jgi:hypothetical protein
MPQVAERAATPEILSTDVRLALAPDATYRRLLADEGAVSWARMLRRPALVLLVIATAVPIMAIQRVTLGLVITAALSWSFVVAIQFLAGAVVIASAPTRRIEIRRALDLWFAGHLPYSVWLLLAAAVMGSARAGSVTIFIASALIPCLWTAAIVAAFCQTVLRTSRAGARSRAAVHVLVVWAIGLSYVAWAAGGWFQLLPS